MLLHADLAQSLVTLTRRLNVTEDRTRIQLQEMEAMHQSVAEQREELAMKILSAAVKTLDMTDKQILAACRPKPLYYATMTTSSQRTCLWCRWRTGPEMRYFSHNKTSEYYGEPICQIETHFMEKHAA